MLSMSESIGNVVVLKLWFVRKVLRSLRCFIVESCDFQMYFWFDDYDLNKIMFDYYKKFQYLW